MMAEALKRHLINSIGQNRLLYTRIIDKLCAYLVYDYDFTRAVNENGVFKLARALDQQQGCNELRGLLLAGCKQSIQDYQNLCKMIYTEIVTENKMRKSRIINDEKVIALANALKPFKRNAPTFSGLSTQDDMLSRKEVYDLCVKNSQIPGVLNALLSKPGVIAKEA